MLKFFVFALFLATIQGSFALREFKLGELIEKNGTYPTLSNQELNVDELKEIKSEVEMLVKMLDLIEGDKTDKTETAVETKKIETEEIHQLIADETSLARHKRATATPTQTNVQAGKKNKKRKNKNKKRVNKRKNRKNKNRRNRRNRNRRNRNRRNRRLL